MLNIRLTDVNRLAEAFFRIMNMLTLHPIPAFTDNYIWCLHDGNKAYVVDPGQAQPVLKYLEQQKLELAGILITHHHWDHVSGLPDLSNLAPNVPVWYPKQEDISHGNHPLTDADTIQLEFQSCKLQFKVILLPGHTLGHIAYFCTETELGPLLFCGDTLFSAGCGRLFEGSPEQMHTSLSKLAALPDTTLVCCTHEYTQSNLKFALAVEPHNKDVQEHGKKVEKLRQQELPSLPTTLATEKMINPFLRVEIEPILNSLEENCGSRPTSPVDSFAKLRAWKDSF